MALHCGFVFFSVLALAAGAKWSYDEITGYGPKNWGKDAKDCDGRQQSPIDVITKNIKYKASLGDITFHHYDKKPRKMTLKNNGHTVVVVIDSDMSLTGGGFDTHYKPWQFHFHWGSIAGPNSEHYIDGRRFPMEMHFVHYSDKYPNVDEAVNHAKGIGAVSFMYEISEKDNEAFNKHLLNHFDQIKNGGEVVIPPFALDEILPKPEDRKHFYRYDGSVTTPACWETVLWTLFNGRIYISQNQLNKFFELMANANDTLIDNSRPLQPLNGRMVWANHLPYTQRSTCGGSSTLPSLLVLVSAICFIRFMY